jgi:glycosidase
MKKNSNGWMVFVAAILLAFTVISCENSPTKENPAQIETKIPLTHVDWSKNANIYEVNLRQYTEEGTMKAFQEQLPRLKAMGVDILWLMPIFPISELNRKGSLGSYYAVADYKGVNPEFGTINDLKDLVDQAHELGMYVILDWVANHSGWDNPWATEHPEWYQHDSTGAFQSPFDWTDVIAFDYSNQALRDSMIGAMKYWVKEADVDGFRCDVAGMVPVDFWNEARQQLDAVKPVFMLAEDEGVVPLLDQAFDMNYGWRFHHVMNEIAQGKKPASDVWKYLEWNDTTFAPNAYRMLFITNHDENSWNGTIAERMGDAGDAMAVLSYTFPGMPLIYSGQEAGMDKRLLFFEKDTIDWSEIKKEAFYTKLNHLKKNNQALWNGLDGGELIPLSMPDDPAMVAFLRQKGQNLVVVMMNLSNAEQTFELRTDQVKGPFQNIFTDEIIELGANQVFNLKPWQYVVLTSKN